MRKKSHKNRAIWLLKQITETQIQQNNAKNSKGANGISKMLLMGLFMVSSFMGIVQPMIAQEQVPEEHIVQTQPTQSEKKIELPTVPEKKATEKTPVEKQKEAEKKIKQEKAEAERQAKAEVEGKERERKDEETRIKREEQSRVDAENAKSIAQEKIEQEKMEAGRQAKAEAERKDRERKDEETRIKREEQSRVDAENAKSRGETWKSSKDSTGGAILITVFTGLVVGLMFGVIKIFETIGKNIKPIAKGTAKAAVGTAKGTGFLLKHLFLSPYYFCKFAIYYPLKGLYMGAAFTIKEIEKRNVAAEVISLILFLSALTGYVIYKATAYSALINIPLPSTGDLIKMLEDPYRAIMWIVFGAAGVLTSISIVRYALRSKKNLPVSGVALSLIIVFSSIAGIANYPLTSYLSKEKARVVAVEALARSRDLTSPEVVDSLIGALGDRSADVRKRAIEALGDCGDKRVIKPLINALDDSFYDPSSVTSALDKIGVIKTIDDIELLKKILKIDSSYSLKSAVTAAFVRMGTAQISILTDMLADDNSTFQKVANDALASIAKENTRSVLDGLEKLFSNESAGVRLRALKIIIGMDNKQDTVSILTRISQWDRDWDVKEKATSRVIGQ